MLRIREAFLPFSRPLIGAEEEQAVLRVLRSGWITTGPETAAFEKEFSAYVGCRHAMAVSSGTAALYVSLKALGVGPGDEVVTPSLTWPATVNAIEVCGATPVFCDVDYATVCATVDTIAPALSDRTRAVMVVHFGGLACDMDPILALLNRRGIALVEDAAHGAGAAYKGEHIGKPHGDLACFSFHPIKNMTTGEGGMVTCSDDALLRSLSLEKFHGVTRDAWKAYGSAALPLYDVERPALKFNMPDLLSTIGRVQLTRLEQTNRRRRELAQEYRRLLGNVPELDLPPDSPRPSEHSWHLFAVKVSSRAKIGREELMRRLKERNVGTGLHFLAIHELSYFRERYPRAGLESSERVGHSIVSLPLFPSMEMEDVQYVCDAVRDSLVGDRQ